MTYEPLAFDLLGGDEIKACLLTLAALVTLCRSVVAKIFCNQIRRGDMSVKTYTLLHAIVLRACRLLL